MNKWKIVLIASLTAFCIGLAGLGLYLLPPLFSGEEKPVVSEPVVSEPEKNEPVLPDNPIDFVALQAGNPDIYAWIKIPGTSVDYAVLRSNDKPEDYYLNVTIKPLSDSIYVSELYKGVDVVITPPGGKPVSPVTGVNFNMAAVAALFALVLLSGASAVVAAKRVRG